MGKLIGGQGNGTGKARLKRAFLKEKSYNKKSE